MKRFYFISLSLLLTLCIYAQESKDTSLEPENSETQFVNRKVKGYYCTMQMSILMGRNQVIDRSAYQPYYSSQPLDILPGNYLYAYYPPSGHNVFAIAPSFMFSNGYMFNNYWAAGAGAGLEIFDYNLFPLFAELRYTYWDHKISPFFTFKGGYALGSFKNKQYEELFLNWSPYYVADARFRQYGGLLVNPELGVKVPLNENSDLIFTAAYRFQKTKSVVRKEYEGGQFDEWERKENISRLVFGITIMFR